MAFLFFVRENNIVYNERRYLKMVLFTILLLTLIITIAIGILLVSICGASVIYILGDVIVCVVLIVLLMRYLIKKRW